MGHRTDHSSLWAIGGLSVLILFLEMALIRWVSTEIRVFAYLQNALLVASFLGLGLGCLRTGRRPNVLLSVLSLSLLTLVIRDPMHWEIAEAMNQGLSAFQDAVVWSKDRGLFPLRTYLVGALVTYSVAFTVVVLMAVAAAFFPLGQWLGRWLSTNPRPIRAYTANIVGSIGGIALFQAATIALTAPWIWLAVSGLGFMALALRGDGKRTSRTLAFLLAGALPLLVRAPGDSVTAWSPYQKLTVSELHASGTTARADKPCGWTIDVNNGGYQVIVNLDPRHLAAQPNVYPPSEVTASHYIYPYSVIPRPRRVLVLGAGAGNDVAAALLAGAHTVEAVEIDPVIARWGAELHPNAPYRSPKVKVVVDDARAFLRRDRGQYDLIWFGLLDSHTTASAYTNVRLDHFVYTRESFADVKRLLAPDGVVVLFFEPQTTWIADRLVLLLRDTFGTTPLAMRVFSSTPCLGFGGLMLVAGNPRVLAGVQRNVLRDGRMATRLIPGQIWPLQTTLPTDDWPYLYLKGPSIPKYHLIVGAICLGLAALGRRRVLPGGGLDMPMLLLGTGFMLLEVSAVNRAALLFGTTWTVNAYVVAALMVMVLLANLKASQNPSMPLSWPFGGLCISLVLIGVVPARTFAALALPSRVILGGGFFALPVFFSGLIFVLLWARAERKDLALGSNILGSLVGGVASVLSMLVGFNAITWLTAACYLLALLFLIRRGQSGDQAEAGAALARRSGLGGVG
jgi:SAM-dependent methyltransferase